MMYRVTYSGLGASPPGLEIKTRAGQVVSYRVVVEVPEAEAKNLPEAVPVYSEEPDEADVTWVEDNAGRILGTKPATVYSWYLEAFPEKQVLGKAKLNALICSRLKYTVKMVRITQYTVRVFCKEDNYE